jgi:hypothetical protein
MILHWTAGGHKAVYMDTLHYHILVEYYEGNIADPADDEINILSGTPIYRNAGDVSGRPAAHRTEGGYAAHTRGFNSGSVGLALCGMRGAADHRPEVGDVGNVDPGPSPITRQQIEVMVGLIVQFCTIWGFRPTEDRVFTHYEAEALHKVTQAGKWDITYIPGKLFSRRDVGPWIRRKAGDWMDGRTNIWPT